MKRIILAKENLKENLIDLIVSEFDLGKPAVSNSYDNSIGLHIDEIVDTAYIFIESPYVDKVYRDSYYTYYSSKFGRYKKDCIRLSFFDGEIQEGNFQTEEEIERLQARYLGFMIIRPTEPYFLGRSVINPKGVKVNHFLNISTTIQATVNSIKFQIEGFPHSSQDTETISCAETTLWALMEYFGAKYPDYKPAPPSKIIEALKKVSSERQIPSRGLNIQQMAFALKEFGFGTKIYSKNQFGSHEFKRLFSTYIESGIPLIVALENSMHGGNIGHAILSVGRARTNPIQIDNLQATVESDQHIRDILHRKAIQLFDNDDIDREFVFVDDNRPVYQLGKLDTPAAHYPVVEWHNCEITHFVVPLYQKVYLEAFKAKNFCKTIVLKFFNIPNGTEIFIRFYLTSSRSYKHSLSLNNTFNADTKAIILETPLPRFIWVGEISSKALIKQNQANGVVLIDATEANMQSAKALIFASYMNDLIFYDVNKKNFVRNTLPLHSFSIFTNNLKGF